MLWLTRVLRARSPLLRRGARSTLETIIDAPPEEVYAVLTDGGKFGAATGRPADVSDEEGDHDAVPPEWEDRIRSNYPRYYQEPLKNYFVK